MQYYSKRDCYSYNAEHVCSVEAVKRVVNCRPKADCEADEANKRCCVRVFLYEAHRSSSAFSLCFAM